MKTGRRKLDPLVMSKLVDSEECAGYSGSKTSATGSSVAP